MPFAASAPAARTIEIVEAPTLTPGPGEVVLEVAYCGICGSDLHFFNGHQPLPQARPGHEISALVEAVGAGVDGLREGDAVTVEPLITCRQCARCKRGDYHHCGKLEFFGGGRPGGMAQQMIAPAVCLHKLPENVDLRLGALTEPLAVGVHAARLAGVGKDTGVLVLGAGAIGLLTVAACKHLGAGFVAVTARHPQQAAAAVALGADQVLDPVDIKSCDPRPQIAIETVGGTATTVADGVSAVQRGGRVIVTGIFDGPPVFDPLLLVLKEVSIVGAIAYNIRDRRSDFSIALDILARRGPELAALVTHTFALDQAQRAFETAADKGSGAVKVMITPNRA